MLKNTNDLIAIVFLTVLGLILALMAWLEPEMRREVLLLMGPWGTMVLQFYFRKSPPAGGTGA